MSEKKKLKVIPIYKFFQIMDLPSKILFGVLFLTLIGFSAGSLISVNDPVQWTLQVEEENTLQEEEVQLREYNVNHREMDTQIRAWKETTSFNPGLISPKGWLVHLFVLGQILGWAVLLTSATYIRNIFLYAIFFVFFILVFMSGISEAILPGSFWIVNIALGIALLVPAYLFNQKILKWKYFLRFMVFLTAVGLPFMLAHFRTGWIGLHHASVGMYIVCSIILIIFIFFTANDLTNLLFFVSTNAKNKKLRLKFPLILGLFLILFGIEFVMLQKEMGWDLIMVEDDFPIRPSHLLAISAVIMVGTKQSLYPVLKEQMDNRSMSMTFASMGIIAMSTFFFHSALGEYLYIKMIERLIIVFFTISTLAHFFYMYYNFHKLIHSQINFYYLSMMPKRLIYPFVIVIVAILSFVLEASQHYRSKKLFAAGWYNRMADQELVDNNLREAREMYKIAIGSAAGTVKGNYNLGMLILAENKSIGAAMEYLEGASRAVPFAYADLMRGKIEFFFGSKSVARTLLRESLKKTGNPYVASNLSQVYFYFDEPDSAVWSLQQALLADPENSVFYSNLGRVYMEFEKNDDAAAFLEAGTKVKKLSAPVFTNAMFLNLDKGYHIPVNDTMLRKAGIDKSNKAWFNMAVDKFRKNDLEGSKMIVDSLLSEYYTVDSVLSAIAPPDVLLLDGMLMFEKGEYSLGISRMFAIGMNNKSYAPYTNHFLGVSYFGLGVPEMASWYFNEAYLSGKKGDLLLKAKMDIDCGNHELAFQELTNARQADSTRYDDINREIALMELARGDYFMAQLQYNLSQLTPEEWARAGNYAGAIGNLQAALFAFEKYAESRPDEVTPYLEMGRISLRLGDTLALQNLAAGLKADPQSIPLKTEMVRAHLLLGDPGAAGKLFKEISPSEGTYPEISIVSAEMDLYKKDTATAIGKYEKLVKKYPFRSDVVLPLVKLYFAGNNITEGINLLLISKDFNSRKVDYWVWEARFRLKMSDLKEMALCVEKALELSGSDLQKAEINLEFKEPLAKYNSGDYFW